MKSRAENAGSVVNSVQRLSSARVCQNFSKIRYASRHVDPDWHNVYRKTIQERSEASSNRNKKPIKDYNKLQQLQELDGHSYLPQARLELRHPRGRNPPAWRRRTRPSDLICQSEVSRRRHCTQQSGFSLPLHRSCLATISTKQRIK
ncbi:hypothetical protein RRG08_054958 [Elysia crispata]|uniref:Uncharacterized protein n=1 Tax=Elysia crispata TaxID=231223 RepID=A0AAE0ZSV3_9GAST|nr:hypothetical protein RRG08_054958 [Elysia crispata]